MEDVQHQINKDKLFYFINARLLAKLLTKLLLPEIV
jgi:hypothetical protein